MKQGFLEQLSSQANKRNRKIFTVLLFLFIGILAFIGFAVKDSIDLSDVTTIKFVIGFSVVVLFFFLSISYVLFYTSRTAVNGKNLILPFNEDTKEAVGKIIDREVAEGKTQADEYIETFSDGKQPHGDRILLLPSYLLICNGMARVTAIPRDKIYWLCAQTARKGYSFIVRLVIFTEKKTFYVEGSDIPHLEKIAEKLYQYIPNVFSDYDPFDLSYKLDSLFDKNREEFLKFYKEEKSKKQKSGSTMPIS